MGSLLSQRHSQVFLTEKGRIDISSHPNSSKPHTQRRRTALRFMTTPNEKRLVCVVVMLLSVYVISAYYLFSSECVTSAIPFSHPKHPIGSHSQQKIVKLNQDQERISHGPSTKFLSYLPHSGFHNQRIALENALVMAQILNRTLLVPPVRLGKGILTYYPFDHLYELVALQGKAGLSHCTNVSAWSALAIECSDYYDYTLLPWNWLTNITSLPESHRLINRWNMSDAWLSSELGINPEDDVFSVKDHTAYQFRFVDADPLDMPGSRFEEVISTSLLAQLPHKLIQLGTLFGSSRLRLREQVNIGTRTEVREAMAFSNPTLQRLAESIKSKLGDTYFAAHIRLGDGTFERKARKNVRMTYWRLLREELGLSEDVVGWLEVNGTSSTLPPPILVDTSVLHTLPPSVDPLPVPAPLRPRLPCRGPLHSDPSLSVLNTPLFISTDASPSNHHLSLFTGVFPCTFFLSDFSQELEELGEMKSSYDLLMLSDFIVSFLDAMVAGNAARVVGTDGSTFSQFVLDVLWRRYHGWNIVQRG